MGNLALSQPALFYPCSSSPKLPGCMIVMLLGSWCVTGTSKPGKGTTRRDAADAIMKTWQLLWEPMAMLLHPNKPQGQHSNSLQREAEGRDNSDIKGHLWLQSWERGPGEPKPQACGVFLPLQCPCIMLTARPRLHSAV